MLATANSNRLEQLEGDPAGLLQPAKVIFFFEDTESIAFDPTIVQDCSGPPIQ